MTISVNSITGERCPIPEILDDHHSIQEFLSNNKGKKVVVVQGLGFVGAVMALVCANALNEEYAVIGVDLPSENSYWKIKSINDGVFPLVADDPKIGDFYQNSRLKGNFIATFDPVAYKYADVIIVDINLDVNKDTNTDRSLNEFDVNLDGFKSAIETIGDHCSEDVLLIVETTVPPGTCEKIVKPILESKFTDRNLSLSRFHLGHSYERVMPGPEYIDSIREYPRVYSGSSEEGADAVEKFLKTIIDTSLCDLTRLEHTNASEMAKVLENSYRATNIAFAVEWSRYAEEAGVDLYNIVNAIRVRNTHSNLMYPGIGVGGYCLTKDPLLASWSRREFFNSKSDLLMSINSVSTNDQMPVFAFERMTEVFGDIRGKKVSFLGVSYRGDVGDTRFSPVEVLVDLVSKSGAIIKLHDPFVSYWEEKKCNIESDIDNVLDPEPDLIIISAGHQLYKQETTIERIMNLSPSKVFDTIGLLNNDQISVLNLRHSVSVLGRGDII